MIMKRALKMEVIRSSTVYVKINRVSDGETSEDLLFDYRSKRVNDRSFSTFHIDNVAGN